MSDFVKVKVSGLRELDRALNNLDLNVRKKAIRPALRKAMKPVEARAKQNVPEDTGGLKKTIRTSTSMSKGNLRKSGGKAAAIGRVSAGRAKKKEGVTGAQALQVEFGTSKTKAKPFLRKAVQGHEKEIISTFAHELGKEIKKHTPKK